MSFTSKIGSLASRAYGWSAAVARAVDQYFEYVTLLLPGNGTNGAQNNTFLDGSTNNFTITRNGNTTQGTFSPFSQTGWGNYFVDNGANASAYLSTTISGALSTALTGASQTREFWWNRTAAGSSNTAVLRVSGGDQGTLYCSGGNLIVYNGSAIITVSLATYVPLGVWTHIALTQGSGVVTLWINGVSRGTSSTVISATGTALQIGGANDMFSCGYISNVRISNSVRYTTSFDPSTVPFVSDANTILLTCQSNRFRDASSNTFTVTPNGSPTVVAFSPFNPTASWSAATYGGSGYFDGSGDYLTTPSTIFNFSAGQAFTVEFWTYISSSSSSQFFIQGGANTFQIAYVSNQIQYDKSGAGVIITGSGPAPNTWAHIAICRNTSNTSRIWVNGNSIGTSSTDTFAFNSATMYIGSTSTPGNYFGGYISDLRVIKNQDLYGVSNTNITVPTAPLTAITNTSLLLNFTNAGIYDATSKNDLETVGNAQISTAIPAKWGTGSMYFDGTGDWLQAPTSSLLNFGSAPYTIEFWYRPNEVSNDVSLIGKYSSSNEWVLQYLPSVSNSFRFAVNSNQISDFSSALSINTWYHIAICRDSSGNLRFFRDGNQVGSTVTSGTGAARNITATNDYLTVGVRGAGTQPVNGYIQDVRLTAGIARYTANFTAPTAAFPTL